MVTEKKNDQTCKTMLNKQKKNHRYDVYQQRVINRYTL